MRITLALALVAAICVGGLALPAFGQAAIPINISGTIDDMNGGPLLAGQPLPNR